MSARFSQLFKKYRLKAEFSTLSELGIALAEKGFIYEDSIFSHWQKGSRIPNNRELLKSLIKIFVERNAIQSIDEANDILSTVNQGYLTKEEVSNIPQISNAQTIPFQVPREIANFTGREAVIEAISKRVSGGGVYLLHGPSGIGKTALVIHLGHTLKKLFPDGIFWFKVDSTNPMEILLSIAFTFHENISAIQSLEIRASIVRSILSNKKVLLIFDNVEKNSRIQDILPNSLSTIFITSIHKDIQLDCIYESIPIHTFSEREALHLFEKITSASYCKKNRQEILDLCAKASNLPLAVHIYAKQLSIATISPSQLLHSISKAQGTLKDLPYENKNLYVSIDLAVKMLNIKEKKVFDSLGIFEGKDFSLDAVSFINSVTREETEKIIKRLINTSLLEESTSQRVRVHPLIKEYIRENTNITTILPQAATYFSHLLQKNRKKQTQFYNVDKISPDKENLIFVLNTCIQQHLVNETIELWKNLGMFFYQTGEWDKVIPFGIQIYEMAKLDKAFSYDYVKYVLDILARVFYLTGNLQKCKALIEEQCEVSNMLGNEYLIFFSKQRLGKILQGYGDTNTSIQYLEASLQILIKYNDIEEIAYTYKFLGEAYMINHNYQKGLESFQKAYKIVSKTGDVVLLGIVHSTLGSIYYAQRKYDKARKNLLAGISLEKRNKIKIGMQVFNNITLALLERRVGNASIAEKYYVKAKKENEYLNIRNNSDKVFAVVYMHKTELEEAGYYIFE